MLIPACGNSPIDAMLAVLLCLASPHTRAKKRLCLVSDDPPSIGFVGLGTMGAPMCARLARRGLVVHAYDLRPQRVQAAVDAGAVAASSAAAAAERAELLLTSLPYPSDVEAVMREGGALAALRPGSAWVDLTTNRVQLIKALADQAPTGVSVADSPVTGAVDGARHGSLTLFLGGAPELVDRVSPVLGHLGRVIPCGPLGTGNVVKLVTNQLWFIHAAALGEGFAIGVGHGVELSVLWEAIKASVGDSFVARHDAPSIFAGHYDPSFTLGLCLKDLALTQELADAITAELPMTAAAQHAFTSTADRYGTDAAELHVARRIEDDAGLDFSLAGSWTPPWEQ
jgi:3-hydroxyisobutyrate dehydrogenase-like beta-hydroxyacid dehydrogenase